MFNRGGFNQSEFNISNSSEVFLNGVISAIGELAAKTIGTFTLSTILSSEGNINGIIYRRIIVSSAMSVEGSIDANNLLARNLMSILSVISDLDAYTTKLHVELIEFMADLLPGDVIIIDSTKKTVTLNGENVADQTEGFMNILPGKNDIDYEDGETVRSVHVRIVHRDKYLY